ncbi:UNVERIFIED_CONTAM: hypothetical protein DES50_11480 [Williamsia faeni]
MLVQRVLPVGAGDESWTVLNDEYAVVEPIEVFLAHLSAIETVPDDDPLVRPWSKESIPGATGLHSGSAGPAQLVTVDLSPVLGWAFHTRRPPIGVSLETRAYGVRFGPDQPGFLVAWLRAASGMWVAIVDVTLVSANTKCSISERFWPPPEAAQRR